MKNTPSANVLIFQKFGTIQIPNLIEVQSVPTTVFSRWTSCPVEREDGGLGRRCFSRYFPSRLLQRIAT